MHTEVDASILARTVRLCREVLGPRAEKVDTLEVPLAENFDALAQCGLAGLTIPTVHGGLAARPELHRQVARELASACGVTHFTVAQHWNACKLINLGRAEPLKGRLLPSLARGRRWVAISFAHLRRPGPPLLRATPVDGGFHLDGTAPWVTGWGLMDSCVFGATLPDGRFVYVWSPFPNTQDAAPSHAGQMQASAPMALCAMTASATVSLSLQDWFVPSQHVLSYTDLPTMVTQDRDNVLAGTNMTLGALRAVASVLRGTAEKKALPSIQAAAAHWESVSTQLLARVEALLSSGHVEDFDTALEVRVDSIEQALRGAHALVAAVSGSANLSTHPAQRLMREAMFYTVQAQTREVMDRTLARLSQ